LDECFFGDALVFFLTCPELPHMFHMIGMDMFKQCFTWIPTVCDTMMKDRSVMQKVITKKHHQLHPEDSDMRLGKRQH
jgi:hypothetical protein